MSKFPKNSQNVGGLVGGFSGHSDPHLGLFKEDSSIQNND